MLRLLGRHWWVLALRGLLAVAFGVLALIWPVTTVRVLVILFGIYALVDGVFSLFSALANRNRSGWVLLLVGAIAGMAVGILAFIWPRITAFALLYLIAGWAIVTGVLELVVAFQLRKRLKGEWALMLAGALSVILGVLLALQPGSGLIAVVWFIGVYAILSGVLLILVGLRLRGWRQALS